MSTAVFAYGMQCDDRTGIAPEQIVCQLWLPHAHNFPRMTPQVSPDPDRIRFEVRVASAANASDRSTCVPPR